MTPEELLSQVLNAADHERSAAIRLAVSTWRCAGRPTGLEQLLQGLVSHSLPDATREDIKLVASLFSDEEVEHFLRTLTSRTPSVDALLQGRAPHAFLSLIADIRDGVIAPMGWWPTDQCALLSALHLAEAVVPEPFPSPAVAQWSYLFIGASPHPHRLVNTRTMFRRSSDADSEFAEFAFSSPHLSPSDRAVILSLMHPLSALKVRHLLPASEFDSWLHQRLAQGSNRDILDCLATDLGPLVVATSDRALRMALGSSLAPIKDLGLTRLAELVGPQDVLVAEAILRESGVTLDELPELVAACRRNP